MASMSDLGVTDIEITLRTSQSVQRANTAPRMTEMPFHEADSAQQGTQNKGSETNALEGFDKRYTLLIILLSQSLMIWLMPPQDVLQNQMMSPLHSTRYSYMAALGLVKRI